MEITAEQLKTKIESGETLLVDFWAPWCAPCRVLKPIFEKLSESINVEENKITMYTFDVETNVDLAMSLGVKRVPTVKGFSKGNEVFSRVGFQTELELKDALNTTVNG